MPSDTIAPNCYPLLLSQQFSLHVFLPLSLYRANCMCLYATAYISSMSSLSVISILILSEDTVFICFFFNERFYLLTFREREEGRKRNTDVGEKCQSGCLLHVPNWGPGPSPRPVPWPRIDLVTFWLAGWCPTPWATPVRALCFSSVANSLSLLTIRIKLVREWGEMKCL